MRATLISTKTGATSVSAPLNWICSNKIAFIGLVVLGFGAIAIGYWYQSRYTKPADSISPSTNENSRPDNKGIKKSDIYKTDSNQDLAMLIQSAIKAQDHVALQDILTQNQDILSSEHSQQTLNLALKKALLTQRYATADILHKNGAKALTISAEQCSQLTEESKLFLKHLWKQEIRESL